MRFLIINLLLVLNLLANNANDVITNNLSIPVSQKSIDMIVQFEVGGGRTQYERLYSRPIVPAWQTTQSGVTIGIGFDCGFNNKEQIRNALSGIIPEEQIKLLESLSGLKGKSAYYNGLPKVRNNVRLSYDQAMEVFNRTTLPRFSRDTANAFGLTKERLHPHSNGALVSLVYNRGALIDKTDRRKEMSWIRHNISTNRENLVPSNIRSMKRLWPYTKLKGLHLRRDAEAKLFQDGLNLK